MKRLELRCQVLVIGLSLFAATQAVVAQPVSFEGKKVEMYIAAAAGGGTDMSSRLVGDVIGKYLPGQPAIVYRNIPGAQGVKALNYVVSRVKPDGLGFVGGSQGHIDLGAKKQTAVQYDPLTFGYFGGLSRGGTILVMRKDAVARLNDKAARPVVVPGVEVNSTGPLMALWGAEYLGWNIKFVIGYSGASGILLAVRSGEADVLATSSTQQIKPMLEDPAFVAYAQFGDVVEGGKYIERANYRGVPVFADLVMPALSPEQREVFATWLQTTQSVDKWFALPPNAPADILAAYRDAFDRAVRDEEFLKSARTQLGDDFSPMSAKLLNELVITMVQKSEAMHSHMAMLRKKYGLPTD